MKVLGIETSCDETGVALYNTERGLVAHALHSQVDLHAVYGGVVPEIASRDHVRMLLPLIQQVMREAGIEKPDAIAYTAGPGLVGALMVGGGMANGLALAWNCPVIPVHHMEGHLLAPMLEDDAPTFPFVALLVSGGHTQLVEVTAVGDYRLLGESCEFLGVEAVAFAHGSPRQCPRDGRPSRRAEATSRSQCRSRSGAAHRSPRRWPARPPAPPPARPGGPAARTAAAPA